MATMEDLTAAVTDMTARAKQHIAAHDARTATLEARLESVETLTNRMAAVGGPSGTRTDGPTVTAAYALPSLAEYRQLETRAQSIGSDTGGGYLVVPEAGPFFDRMRPATVVLAAGPQIIDMQSDSLKLPGLASSTTVNRTGEADTITESDVALRNLVLMARKYTIRTVSSSEFMADANPSAREILAMDHERQLAARLDADMLEGNTGGHITGFRRISGVTTTELGSGNGATPALNNINDALYRLEADNADRTRVAIFMHPRTWNTFSKLLDLQDRYQLQPDPTTDARRSLFGRPVFVSPQITITETVGGSSDCSYIVLADMSKVVVGRRLTLGVLYDPYSKSGTDQVVVQTQTRWDMNVLHTEAVEVLTGVRP